MGLRKGIPTVGILKLRALENRRSAAFAAVFLRPAKESA